MLVKGVETCKWTETRPTVIDYEEKNEFYTYKNYLLGYQDGENIQLDPGDYSYNFSATLPTNVPYSYKGTFGEIEYSVSAVLDTAWYALKRVEVPFSVRFYEDLNRFPDLAKSASEEKTKNFEGFFQDSPLTVAIGIPHSGYSKGQSIPITLTYNNPKKLRIERTLVKLVREIRYKAFTPKKSDKVVTQIVVEQWIHEVVEEWRKNLTCKLEIPRSAINSCYEYSKLIKIHYYLEVGCVSPMLVNMGIRLPIEIGSVGIGEEKLFNINVYSSSEVSEEPSAFRPLQPLPSAPRFNLEMPKPSPSAPSEDDLRKRNLFFI